MQLNYLKGTNWCQHNTLNIKFSAGVTGIIGVNGTGKSNMLNAIYMLLTGTVPYGSLFEYVQNGELSTDIEGGILVGDDECVITRRIRRRVSSAGEDSTDATVTSSLRYKNEVLKGNTKVTDRIQTLLGVSTKMLQSYTFVTQDKLAELLFQDRSKRIDELMLLNPDTARVKSLVYALNSALDATPRKSAVEESYVARMRNDIAAQEAQVATINHRDHEARKAPVAEVDSVSLAKQLADSQAAEAAKAQHDKLVAAGTATHARVQALTVQSCTEDQLQANALTARDQQEPNRKQAAELLASIPAIRNMKAVRVREDAALLHATSKLASLAPPGAYVVPADYENALQQRAALSEELAAATRVKHALTGTEVKCPTCNQDIADCASMLAEADETIKRCGAELHTCTTLITTTDAAVKSNERAQQTYEASRTSLEAEVTRATSALAALPADQAIDEAAVAAAQGVVTMFAQLTAALATQDHKCTAVQAELHAAEADSERITAEIKTLEASPAYTAPVMVSTDVEAIQQSLASYTEYVNLLNSLGVQRAAVQEALERDKLRLAELLELTDEAGRVDNYRETLEAAKDRLHRDMLPGRVLADMGAKIANVCNMYLDAFDRPFAIKMTENMDITAIMPSGYVVTNLRRLSGGQKCVLSVAFRLALYQLFAAETGILVLDEPTEYMDDTNRALMAEVISRGIRTSRHAGNMQILIITHAKELIPACDTVLRL